MIYISKKIRVLEQGKKAAGIYAAGFVKQGMTIGIGTGSTVHWFIQELGKRVQQGLSITAVSTSSQTDALAKEAGIAISELNAVDKLMLAIDGADEIDPEGYLIKGGGGALLREKIVAAASDDLIIIADTSKLVEHLGKFRLPVEVIPFGYKQVQLRLLDSGFCREAKLRERNGEIFITDHGNYILDCDCGEISDAAKLNSDIHQVPGVVETGLFVGMTSLAIIGDGGGRVEVKKYKH